MLDLEGVERLDVQQFLESFGLLIFDEVRIDYYDERSVDYSDLTFGVQDELQVQTQHSFPSDFLHHF